MRTWNDYKDYVKAESIEARQEMENCEELSRVLSSALQGMYNFGLLQTENMIISPDDKVRQEMIYA